MTIQDGATVRLGMGSIYSNIKRLSKSSVYFTGVLVKRGSFVSSSTSWIEGRRYKFHSRAIREVMVVPK